MRASTIKSEALAWLRYGKRFPIVCTEVGTWYADVFGVSRTMSVEVETKISRSDLRAEFKNKTQKHHLYQNADGSLKSVPNYLYFMVPEALKDDALEIVGQGNPKAGVAIYTGDSRLAGKNTAIVRPPKKLHDAKPSDRLIRTAILRMSSELCGIWGAHNGVQAYIQGEVNRLVEGAIAASFRVAGNLDVEAEEESLDLRAAELAMAVEGADWATVTSEEKARWKQAALKLLDISGSSVEEWKDASKLL